MSGVYPPPDQVLSALGIEVCWVDDDTLIGRASVGLDLLGTGSGPPGVGALVPIVDLVAGSLAKSLSSRDWLATADVWLYERAPMWPPAEAGRPIEVQTRLLRAGRRSVVVAVEVTAGAGGALSSTIEFSRIRRDATELDTRPPAAHGNWLRLGSGPLLDRPLVEACGFRVVDAGTGAVEVDRGPFVNNSIGTLQGGVIALLADVSAVTLIGPGARTVDLHFRFLDQTGDGPAAAVAEIVRSDGDGHTVQVEIVDASTGGLVGWANCRVQTPTV